MCASLSYMQSIIASLERYALAFSWQGGGINVNAGGDATLINSNVYQNAAISYVCSTLERSVAYLPAPRWNVTVLTLGRVVASMSTLEAKRC